MDVPLTILEGSTFVICDELGDVETELAGFFADDTRYLSVMRLTIDGMKPLPLEAQRVEYFSAAFYMRNPVREGLPQDSLLIVRSRFVGESLQDHLVIDNVGEKRVSFDVHLQFACDFADIFAVKERDFSLGHPDQARPLPPLVGCVWDDDGQEAVIDDGSGSSTRIVLSVPGNVCDRGGTTFQLVLEPRQRWELLCDVIPLPTSRTGRWQQHEQRFGDELRRVRNSLAAWQLRIPQIRATWDPVRETFDRSVADLASLRIRSRTDGGELPAAGMPWFMAVFGRDTIITSLQTLLFGPQLARTALYALADLQADVDDPSTDAEPGKIVHEVRHGKAGDRWFPRYYGTADATPLFLILLSEVWAWTEDRLLVEELREPALRALRWIDEYGDRDGDGFVEYERRTTRGLQNQSWKDSDNSQRFRDGRYAQTPIAPCEVQGYVFDAKRRIAEIAREAWRDRGLADRLDREAEELQRRFNEAFWLDDRGGYYALALDADKRRVDSLTSNIGHLLWSGIVPDHRVEQVVDRLMGADLWSGWGVRTMASSEAAYNPLSYHNGTVWPHDNALIAGGLARMGHWHEMHRLANCMFEAARNFEWGLPEVFAGITRGHTPYPIPYPTASRPQAWAAGTPILLLQLLLGLRPDRRTHTLTSIAPAELPAWVGDIRLSGVRAFEQQWDVTLRGGAISIERG